MNAEYQQEELYDQLQEYIQTLSILNLPFYVEFKNKWIINPLASAQYANYRKLNL